MARLISEYIGVRGRELKLYDTKVVIITKPTLGGIVTGNLRYGEKTIFLSDVVGVQFKKSQGLVGYLQFETPSMQMKNFSDNTFSENTFVFEDGQNGITNDLMEKVYTGIVDLIEQIKFGFKPIVDFDCFLAKNVLEKKDCQEERQDTTFGYVEEDTVNFEPMVKDLLCPYCNENLDFMCWSESDLEESLSCPLCGMNFKFEK